MNVLMISFCGMSPAEASITLEFWLQIPSSPQEKGNVSTKTQHAWCEQFLSCSSFSSFLHCLKPPLAQRKTVFQSPETIFLCAELAADHFRHPSIYLSGLSYQCQIIFSMTSCSKQVHHERIWKNISFSFMPTQRRVGIKVVGHFIFHKVKKTVRHAL